MKRTGKVSVPVARAMETKVEFLIAARTRPLEWLTQIDVRSTLRLRVLPWVSHPRHQSHDKAQAMAP
jgi:hypothetical protein